MNHKVSKQILSILLAVVMLVGLMPTTAFAATTIDTINIKGITTPVAGATPVVDGVTTDTAGITLTTVQWQKDGGVILNFSDKFEAGQTYYLWVRYEVAAGYEVSDDVTVTSDLANSTYEINTMRVKFQYTVPAAPKYTVTVTGGGTVEGKASVTTEAGTRLQLRAPEVSGKRFTGWSGLDEVTFYGDNAKVTDPVLGFIMPAKTFTVTANYQDAVEISTINIKGITKPLAGANPVNFGVTTDTTGLSVKEVIWYFDRTPSTNVPHDYEFQLGDKLYLLVFLDIADGYTFANSLTITADLEYTAAYRMPTTNTIYLEYTVTEEMPTTYTVSFDANDGTGTMTAATGVSGEYELPACTFTAPSDKQFKAWSVGGVEKAVGDKITVTADTTVTAVWENVSEYTKKGDISAVEATAVLPPVLGATTYTSVTITDPTDAAAKGVIISGTSWYKKDASSIYGWTQCSNGVDTFEEGTYRLSVQLRSKSNDDKEYYAMSDATTFTVNGVQWNSEEPFRDNYATSGYGYRFFVSPEFTLGRKTLDSIAVTTPPTKTAYREGEDFNPAGMVVTATYTDSSTAPVILYTVTDGTDMVAGKTSVTISYTEGGVTETTTQPITVAKEYTVTVNGGTGNGEYIAGEEVSISAFVSTGMQFKEWQGTDGLTFTSGDKNSQTATFTMPAHDVTVTAVTGPAEYYVSVSGGSGTGMYEAGATVTIVADPPEAGKQFKEWSVGDGKVLRFTESDITSSTAKFVMPGEAVRISATYEDIPVTTYTVSFDANGGTGTMADVTGISGEYTLPENGFTAPDGKQFKAWSVGGSEKAVGDKITVTADTTVTAVWETIPAGHTCDIKPVAKVNPSCTEGGKEAYYKCEGCGKFYEDALGTKEITDLASWGNLAKLGHTESDWKSDKDNHWKECTVAACGVIIENSKAAHADANNDGKCDVCEYNVGKTSTNPGNKPSDDVQNPQTGDNSMMWLWIALLFVSGFGVVTTTVYTKKRKSVK